MRVSPRGRTRATVGRPRVMSRAARVKRFLAISALVMLTAVAGVLMYGLWLVRSISAHLPAVSSIADVRVNPVTTLFSSDGVVLASFRTQYRLPVSLSDISPSLIEATIATEDSRFYAHHGVDFRGVGRALFANLRSDTLGQGGSTITQQLARNLYLTREKTWKRKIAEMLLARRIEQSYSKQEILEAYLNTVYYGSGSYGAEAAARTYFGKPAKALTLGEAALLAGLPQRPAAYTPTQHLEAALQRRDFVLDRMVDTGKITPAQKAQAEKQPLHILHPRLQTMADWRAPYFVEHVLELLRDRYGPEFLYSGAQIVTSLNWKMQHAAEQALRTGLHRSWGPNTGALVSLDPHTGYVRALVGGPDFRHDQFDAAIDGVRQPGSAFKPIVYAAAFDNNVCNLLTPMEDKKLVYQLVPKDWVVHNYDGAYHGPMTVLDALRHSINTVAVQVADQVGPSTIASYGQRLGLTTPLDPVLPLALGASGVHPIDLCSAFTAFANGGPRYTPAFLLRITDTHDAVLYQDDPAARLQPSVMSESAVEQINVALREVVTSGTGHAANAIPDAHGKTGTTSSHRDAWFVGYTGDLATAVWVAREHKSEATGADGIKTGTASYAPMPGETGGKLCAPIWRAFMAQAIPVQQRANLARGLQPALVPGPSPARLIADMKQEQSAQAQRMAAAQPDAANGANPAPPGFLAAQNGSGPVVVTAPPDAPETRQATVMTNSVLQLHRSSRLHGSGDGSRASDSGDDAALTP